MRVIIHDLGPEYEEMLKQKCDTVIYADGNMRPVRDASDAGLSILLSAI